MRGHYSPGKSSGMVGKPITLGNLTLSGSAISVESYGGE